ncbi:hypothetical protein L4D00_17820 [Photobacterium swingsii]|uniref:hypothetical protein n=1 Tax=Photobacterium swingsii TaxID=680026 RepID=UPI003551E363
MLTTFLRVLMVVFCLGAGSFAHADDMRTPQIPAATSLHYSQQVHDSLSAQHSMQALDTAAHFPQLQCLFKRTLKVNHQQPEKGSHTDDIHRFHLGMMYTSRYSSMLRDDPENIQPSYQLAHELPIAPSQFFVIGYQAEISPSVDWMLTHVSSSSRLSGWKESNLTYTQYQHRLITA